MGEVTTDVLIKRLRRIEGQVRGLQKMVIAGRECENIVTQLVAVRSAIDSVGALVLNNYMNLCLRNITDESPEAVSSLAKCVAIWGRVRVTED